MFCFQCEQTQDHTGCKTVGVCGKTPEVSALQDLLIFQTRRLAVYLNELLKEGVDAKELFEKNRVSQFNNLLTHFSFLLMDLMKH
jgi:hydroxylamine reductase